jgi:hypothetical protein
MRAERICARGAPRGEGPIRQLDDTVVLEDLRCGGEAHAGCQLGCMFLWKEAWLARVDGPCGAERGRQQPAEAPIGAAPADGGRWRCQATELVRASRPSDRIWNPAQYLRMLRVRTLAPAEMAKMYVGIAVGRLRRAVRGLRPLTRSEPGRISPLGLAPGERVRVKDAASILATLDGRGSYRGLGFSVHMFRHCGRERTVLARVGQLIAEETGELRAVRDTVILEGAICDRHQGCARAMPSLWREAWLERVVK